MKSTIPYSVRFFSCSVYAESLHKRGNIAHYNHTQKIISDFWYVEEGRLI